MLKLLAYYLAGGAGLVFASVKASDGGAQFAVTLAAVVFSLTFFVLFFRHFNAKWGWGWALVATIATKALCKIPFTLLAAALASFKHAL